MTREPQVPRPSSRALAALFAALEDQAAKSEDVRAALVEVQAWLALVLARDGDPGLRDEVLVPAPDRRSAGSSARSSPGSDADSGARGGRDPDLVLVSQRARWKADAVAFAIDRRERSGEPGAPASGDPDGARERERTLRERAAKLRDCSTWWLGASHRLHGVAELREISACYALLSRAAQVVQELEESGALEPAPPSDLLYLLAEIQSALLASLATIEQRHDEDQRDLFGWLKAQTTRHRIYVDRHMRLDDPAELGRSEERAARLEHLRRSLIAHHERRRGRQRILRKARYHLQKAEDAGAAGEHDHAAFESAARDWCELGLPPGDPAFRQLASEFERAHGGGRSPGAHLARVLDAEVPPATRSNAPRLDALEVLPAMLDGRSALLFADDESPDGGDALRSALGLSELRWVVLPDDADDAAIEARIEEEIAATDPGLVLLGRRLPPDAYASFKRHCLETQRPFVRLVQGHDPSRVAHQILRQIGWRLRAAHAGQSMSRNR